MIETLKQSDMHKYQLRMVDWVLKNQNSALWADPGLGKTVVTLTAIKQLKADFEINRSLVVAPLRVARSVWPKEIKRWEHLQEMTCENLYWPGAEENTVAYNQMNKEGLQPNDRDSNKERLKKLKRRDAIMYKLYIPWLRSKLSKHADIYTINREQVHLLCRILYLNWGFDNVILDEASSFKNPASQRWQGLKHIRSKIYRLLELTGTPASNGLMNIWAQVWLMDQGESLYRTISAFRDTYYNKDHDGYNYTIRDGAKKVIYEKVEHLCLTMLAEDYLELPELIPVMVPLELPPKARAMYNELEREFMLTIDDETVNAVHTAALHNKLRQICNGTIYTDGTLEDPENDTQHMKVALGKKNWKKVHDVKIDALRSIYEEAESQPVLVAYGFLHDLARLKKAFPEARTLDSEKTIDEWNAGEITMLLVHPASAGHGLNLQFGGHIAVWYGITWDLELYEQFNKRLDRQGQEKPVIIHHLYIDNATERTMLESLKEKRMGQRELLMRMKKKITSD